MCNVDNNNKCLKKQTFTFTSVLLKHLISIWSHNEIILEGSYWSTDKNTTFANSFTQISKRATLYLEKKLSFQCGWWRRFRAAYAKLRNCRVGILKLISNILHGNCQSTDKNTCNVDITTNIRKIKLYLYLWKILLQFDPTMKSSSKEVTEVPTRMYTTWTKRQISKRANLYLEWTTWEVQAKY